MRNNLLLAPLYIYYSLRINLFYVLHNRRSRLKCQKVTNMSFLHKITVYKIDLGQKKYSKNRDFIDKNCEYRNN